MKTLAKNCRAQWLRLGLPLVLALLPTATDVLAQTSPGLHYGLAGGVGIPLAGHALEWDKGYQICGLLGYATPTPVGFRLELGFSRFNSTGTPRITNARRDILSGVADITVTARSSPIRPYGLVGVGVFKVKAVAHAFDPFATIHSYVISSSQTAFGFNVGGGVSIPLGARSAAFLEGRYSYAATSSHNSLLDDGLSLVQLVAGISF